MSLRGRQFSRKIKNLKTNPRREAQDVKNAKRGIYKQRLISIATFFFFHLKHFLVISNIRDSAVSSIISTMTASVSVNIHTYIHQRFTHCLPIPETTTSVQQPAYLLVRRWAPSPRCCLECLVYPGNTHNHKVNEASVIRLCN